jgi:hypothetical protein
MQRTNVHKHKLVIAPAHATHTLVIAPADQSSAAARRDAASVCSCEVPQRSVAALQHLDDFWVVCSD